MSDNIGSPILQSRHSMESPWNRVVQGSESKTIVVSSPDVVSGAYSPQSVAAIELTASGCPSPKFSVFLSPRPEEDISENGFKAHVNAGKRLAWNRPLSVGAEVGLVMGAEAWPALSESVKAPLIKSPSVPHSQKTTISSAASASTYKYGNLTNSNSRPSQSRQRLSNRQNGFTSSANGSPTGPLPQGSPIEGLMNGPSSGYNKMNGIASQCHGGNDNLKQNSTYRNQNGNHHQNHGGRRNQDHGNNNWTHQNYNGKDGYTNPHRTTSFMRNLAPPILPPFFPIHLMQPFSNIVVYPEGAPIPPFHYGPLPPFGVVPYVSPPSGPSLPHQVQDLYNKLRTQIDWYFSDENLVRDIFLRQHMDEQGYVNLQLIASFRKVRELTDNIPLILDALRNSFVVELQGENLRRRNDWNKYLLPETVRSALASSPRPRKTSNKNVVTTQLHNLSLEKDATDQTGMSNGDCVLSRTSTSKSSPNGSNAAQPQQTRNDPSVC